MSARRTFEVFRLDLAHHVRRPIFWILLVLIAFSAWGLSSGHMRISTGDSDVGGTKAWITSQFAMARVLAALILLFYCFFIAVAAGMVVIRDDELKVGEVLHSTPLSPGEYVWGKFLAVLAAFLLVLALQLGFHAFANHALATAATAEFVGPFEVGNYLLPALYFCLPTLLFFTGTSFAIGAILRRPILVFVLPVAFLMACGFFLWSWSPTWLEPWINRALMWVDPSGYRWLNETWVKVDRGVAFYNSAPIPLDVGFVASRLAFVALGLGAVALSQARLSALLRGSPRRPVRASVEGAREPTTVAAPTSSPSAALAELGMTRRRPGFVAATIEVARIEMRELRSQAGLYLFPPLILLQTIGSANVALGPFETPLLVTSGTLATRSMNTLTMLLCPLLLFYTVLSLEREKSRGLTDIYHATPVHSGSILLGKTFANSLVGIVILLAAFLGCALVLVVQGKAPLELQPFLLVWGALLVPTLILWCCFVAAVHSVTRSSYSTYGVCIAAGLATLVLHGFGHMNWVGNWALWDVVGTQEGSRWSDIGTFELMQKELWLNRLLALALAALFLVLALRFFPRRAPDPSSTLQRLRPAALCFATLRLSPWIAVPFGLGLVLWIDVRRGFEGEYERKRGKNYWAKNVATFKDAPVPSITAVELDLELEPARRWFRSRGTYTLLNDRTTSLRQIPVTVGSHYEDLEWTLAGEPYEPENRAGLYVFTLAAPLAPGDVVNLGFAHAGVFPKGASENSGGSMEFIVPSGVVLTSFGPAFVPQIGFNEGIGVDEDNHYDAREYTDDFYVGLTDSAFGNNTPHTTRITVHAPEEFIVNSVGTLTHEEVSNGVRTVVWESDHPVSFFNIVAGRWAVRRGEGTAIYYHPGHGWNIEEMLKALDGARHWFSEWFHPFPWKELKLSEFPALATYAQGFPTNITFSEGIGFLTESDPKTELAFLVTAHEAAHQWWGNILEPGKGPGGNILSEGMAHFSTILLLEQVLGLRERIEFCKRIEERYGDRRQVDSERPLVKIDGSRAGDTTVTYDKGGWVFWMLLNRMGRDHALRGCQEFIRRFEKGPDHPVLQDFVATLREFAVDAASYDEFVKQWFFEVGVPQYELSAGERELVPAANGGSETWEVRVHVKNTGGGTMPVEIAAACGERFPDAEEATATEPAKGEGDVVEAAAPRTSIPDTKVFRDQRATIVLGPGEEQDVVLRCDFEPERVLVDPDALVLQLQRKVAIVRF